MPTIIKKIIIINICNCFVTPLNDVNREIIACPN